MRALRSIVLTNPTAIPHNNMLITHINSYTIAGVEEAKQFVDASQRKLVL